jgi:hypothetical protein
MRGPYRLEENTIDEKVTEKSPGNYALGEFADDGAFKVGYIGRSDSDIRGKLKSWVTKDGAESHFKFSYATSAQVAFEKECGHYHDFRPPGKHVHPVPPPGKDWRCPLCGLNNAPE